MEWVEREEALTSLGQVGLPVSSRLPISARPSFLGYILRGQDLQWPQLLFASFHEGSVLSLLCRLN